MKVLFIPSARTQFLAVVANIHRENPVAAMSFRRRAEKVLAKLRKFPRLGRVLPEFPDLPFREVIVAPYRFFYKIKGKTVWIVGLWHGVQLPERPNDAENA